MQPERAVNRADEIINLLLTHHPGALGVNCLVNTEEAVNTAQVLAEFRQNLIALLVQQQ